MLNLIARKQKIACILAAVALLPSGVAIAAPLLDLTIEGSTTGSTGSFSSALASAPAANSTVFFEVVAQFAAAGTTNANTTKTPNGTTDSVVALPDFTLTGSGATFNSAALQNNFSTGSGAVAGITGSSSLDIRAIEQGFTENADSPLVIESGTFTAGSSFAGISGSTDPTVNTTLIPAGATSGDVKLAGSLVAITSTTEASSDPMLHYVPLTITQASSNKIISLVAGSSAQSSYGTSLAPLSITGSNGSYVPASESITATATGNYSVSGFNPATDGEIYALQLADTGPDSISQIISLINTAGNSTGVTAESPTPAIAALFPGYNLELVATNPTSATDNLGFDFTQAGITGVTVTGVAVVPEPVSASILGLGGLLFLARRRSRNA